MKYLQFIFSAIILLITANQNSVAQTGWKWAVNANGYTNNLQDPIAATSDIFGNIYVSGTEHGDSVSYGPYKIYEPGPFYQGFVVKIDSSGHYKWAVGTQKTSVAIYALTADRKENVYLSGRYAGDSLGIGAFTLHNPYANGMNFLAKISANGTVKWAININRTFTISSQNVAGVGTDDACNIYLAGTFITPTVTFGGITLTNPYAANGSSDIFLVKFDSSGNTLWAKSFGGHHNDFSAGLTVSYNGNVVMPCSYDSSITIGTTTLSDSMNLLAKFDSSGNLVWARNIHHAMKIHDVATDAYETPYITGSFNQTIVAAGDTLFDTTTDNFFLAKYDSSGNLSWARAGTGPGMGTGYKVSTNGCRVWASATTSDSGVNFGTHHLSIPSGSGPDPSFLVSFDTAGNYITGMAFQCGGDDFSGVILDGHSNLYFTGDYSLPQYIFGHDTLHFTGASENFFIAKYAYDTIECHACSAAPVASFTLTGGGMMSTVTFNYTGSTLYDSLVWDFGDGTSSHTVNPVHSYAFGLYHVCLKVYSSCIPGYVSYCTYVDIGEGVPGVSNGDGISIYPNPATDICVIHSEQPFPPNSHVTVYDITGKRVGSYPLSGNDIRITTTDLSPGVYQCGISIGMEDFVMKKLVVIR